MPASARGARMPPGNRFSTSESLNSHSVWKSSIGYDPYSNSKDRKVTDAEAAAVRGRENDFAEFKGLTKLLSARGAGQSSEGARVWKGKKPLKGVFAEPMFGYQEETSRKLTIAAGSGTFLNESSEDESASDASTKKSSSSRKHAKKRHTRHKEKKKRKKRSREDDGEDRHGRRRKRKKEKRKKRKTKDGIAM